MAYSGNFYKLFNNKRIQGTVACKGKASCHSCDSDLVLLGNLSDESLEFLVMSPHGRVDYNFGDPIETHQTENGSSFAYNGSFVLQNDEKTKGFATCKISEVIPSENNKNRLIEENGSSSQ